MGIIYDLRHLLLERIAAMLKDNKIIETKYRFFGPMILSMENWLNRMSSIGNRLVDTGKMSWDFEPCSRGKYEYRVEYAGQLNLEKNENYLQYFRDKGYNVLTKPLNLNFSLGKAQIRTDDEGEPMVVTKNNVLDKEIIIIEKLADGTPFDIPTNNLDRTRYLKPLFRTWIVLSVLMAALAIFMYAMNGADAAMPHIVLAVFCIAGTGLFYSNMRALKKKDEK